jgi:hypothetical protein
MFGLAKDVHHRSTAATWSFTAENNWQRRQQQVLCGAGGFTMHIWVCHTHRRRPFLVRGLENTLVKLLLSLEFFDEQGRHKIAIGEQRATF